MFILRNAVRSILRSPGRTIIICIIVVVIATSACIALSIQQSAGVARQRTEDTLQIRAHINVDRQYVMEALQNSEEAADLKEGVSTFFADLLKGLDDYGAKK